MENEQLNVFLNDLNERMNATQNGLRSLFQSLDIQFETDVTQKDLYQLALTDYDAYLAAVAIIYPELNKENATGDVLLYKTRNDTYKNSLERNDELGLDPDYVYTPKDGTYEVNGENTLFISWKKIAIVVIVIVLVVALGVWGYKYYKKHKKA